MRAKTTLCKTAGVRERGGGKNSGDLGARDRAGSHAQRIFSAGEIFWATASWKNFQYGARILELIGWPGKSPQTPQPPF